MKLNVVMLMLAVYTAMCSNHIVAQEDEEQRFIAELQKNPDIFEIIELNKAGEFTDFEVNLGASMLTRDKGDQFDGFRFKVPEGVEEYDFVLYFNVPTNWSHWYLCPVEGRLEGRFNNGLDADKLYKKFDRKSEESRWRAMQTLNAGYLKAGKEYIMWFRKIEDGDARIAGRILFTKLNEKWDYESVEKLLNLEPMSINVQVEQLASRGGGILLDEDFFKKSYAEDRINNIFYSLRRTTRFRDGTYITRSISAPPCDTHPSIDEIRKRHGEPDFILTGEEKNIRAKHTGGIVDHDSNVITYYYDYCGFEVKLDDPKGGVQNVETQVSNYSDLRHPDKGASFGRVSMENLTTFSQDGKEVGRMYFFLESGKEPLSVKMPPKGRYKQGKEVLECLGEGEWLWSHFYEDGSVERKISVKNNKMHGKAEGFYADGVPRFVVFYKNGLLDGKAVRYSEDGKVIDEAVFVEGKRQVKD